MKLAAWTVLTNTLFSTTRLFEQSIQLLNMLILLFLLCIPTSASIFNWSNHEIKHEKHLIQIPGYTPTNV